MSAAGPMAGARIAERTSLRSIEELACVLARFLLNRTEGVA
jgi:hypothetical protein